MWNVKAGVCAEQFERAQEHGGAGRSIDVVVAVDQESAHRVSIARLQTSDGLPHAEHGIRFVKLIVSWREEDARSALVGVSAVYEKSSQDW